MLGLSLGFDELRPDDVPNSVSDEGSSGHDSFLSSSSHVAGTNCNDQADDWAEEASEGITDDWGSRVVSPLRLPDHDTAGDDRETACNEHRNTCVGNDGGNISAERNENDTNSANGELEQNRVQGIVTKCRDDQGSESRNGSVNCVSGKISMWNLWEN